MRDDLGFFEKLIPSSGVDGVAIRGLQAELQNDMGLKWQVLVIQASKNAPEFNGQLELSFSGVLGGKPWSANLPTGPVGVKLHQYERLEGSLELPAQVVVKTVSAKLSDGGVVRSTQTIKL